MKAFALVVCARRTRAERFFHIEASSNGIVREKEASELNILLRLYHSEQEKNTIHVHQFAALEYLDFPDPLLVVVVYLEHHAREHTIVCLCAQDVCDAMFARQMRAHFLCIDAKTFVTVCDRAASKLIVLAHGFVFF